METFEGFKDAMSVSKWHFNESQTLRYVKYTKWNSISKGMTKFHDTKTVFGLK